MKSCITEEGAQMAETHRTSSRASLAIGILQVSFKEKSAWVCRAAAIAQGTLRVPEGGQGQTGLYMHVSEELL